MKNTSGLPKALVLVLVMSALAAGCTTASRSAQFYTLSPMAASVGASARVADKPAVAVGPLTLPPALQRPQIVTRIGDNQLKISEFHRWAGSLERDVTLVVAENLGLLLDTEQVAAYPWEAGFKPAFRVGLNILRLDGRLGQEVVLSAVWTVWSGPQGETAVAGGKTEQTEKVTEDGYEALVAAYSRLLETMSREIAAAISRL